MESQQHAGIWDIRVTKSRARVSAAFLSGVQSGTLFLASAARAPLIFSKFVSASAKGALFQPSFWFIFAWETPLESAFLNSFLDFPIHFEFLSHLKNKVNAKIQYSRMKKSAEKSADLLLESTSGSGSAFILKSVQIFKCFRSGTFKDGRTSIKELKKLYQLIKIHQIAKAGNFQTWIQQILSYDQLKAADRQLILYNTMDRWQEHTKQRVMLCSAANVFRESADSQPPCVDMIMILW